ncbi:membrane protein [Bacillus phage YungSlug]|nr:membrane protein [Bacillus phage YungSlug]
MSLFGPSRGKRESAFWLVVTLLYLTIKFFAFLYRPFYKLSQRRKQR